MKVSKVNLRRLIKIALLESIVKLPSNMQGILLAHAIGVIIQKIKVLYEQLPDTINGFKKSDPDFIYKMFPDDINVQGKILTPAGQNFLLRSQGPEAALFFLSGFFKVSKDESNYFSNSEEDLIAMGDKYSTIFLSNLSNNPSHLFMKSILNKMGLIEGVNIANFRRSGDYSNYTIVMGNEKKIKKLFEEKVEPYILRWLGVEYSRLEDFDVSDVAEERERKGTKVKDLRKFKMGFMSAEDTSFIVGRLNIFLDLLKNLNLDDVVKDLYNSSRLITKVNIEELISILKQYDTYIDSDKEELVESGFDADLYFELSNKIKEVAANTLVITRYHGGSYEDYKRYRSINESKARTLLRLIRRKR